MIEQTHAPILGWKLSLVMGLILLSVLGGGLVARNWFAPPPRQPSRTKPIPTPLDEKKPRIADEPSPPAPMPEAK